MVGVKTLFCFQGKLGIGQDLRSTNTFFTAFCAPDPGAKVFKKLPVKRRYFFLKETNKIPF
jgi:hypothetical protein